MTDEAPKPQMSKPGTPDAPSPEKAKPLAPTIIYWSAYAALVAAAVGGSIAIGALGFPAWLATILAAAAIGVAVWFLEDSAINPRRDMEKDPFNRGFFTLNVHMFRAWRLRGGDVEWRETRAADLPQHAVHAFKDQLGVDPQVMTDADGLVWIAGERDFHGGFDPPRFVVVAFDASGKVRAADDLHHWPRRWRIPNSEIQGRWMAADTPIRRS